MTRIICLEPPPDELDWVARLRGGDSAAFEAIFRSYHQELCNFAYRYVRSQETAEDIVHDVFAKLWLERRQFDVRDNLRAYLYRAVRNRAISLLRHQGVESRWLDRVRLHGQVGPRRDAQRGLELEELGAAVERVLSRLPPRCRTALALRWQGQMSYAEVAKAMGISIKTVEVYITRGLAALRTDCDAFLPHT